MENATEKLGKNPCVLLVDEEPGQSRDLNAWLAGEPVDLVQVARFAEAVRVVRDRKVLLCVLDADGCPLPITEAIAILRGLDPAIAIIVSAARNTAELEKEIRAQKVFYYHVKGFGPSDLALAVKSAIGRSPSSSPQHKEAE